MKICGVQSALVRRHGIMPSRISRRSQIRWQWTEYPAAIPSRSSYILDVNPPRFLMKPGLSPALYHQIKPNLILHPTFSFSHCVT